VTQGAVPREADVIIIGGGLHGCSAALHLARDGKRVIVLERRAVGQFASGVNAGGVRRLGRDPTEVALSMQGQTEYWHRIRDWVDDDCGFVPCGHIKIAETADELAQLEARATEVRGMGFAHEEVIGRDELLQLVPALAPHCVGALIVRDDGAADPYRTTFAFAAKARSLGVQIVEGEGVVAMERAGADWQVVGDHARYRAPVVVNAAGAWAARIAALIGDDIPLKTRASMMMVTERVPSFIKPVIGATGRALSFKQTAAGSVLVGGGQQGRADLDVERAWVNVRNLARSARTVAALFPQMRGVRIARSWCGIEAETPDAIPVIDISRVAPGIVHSFGYSGHGFQLGPICGRAVADLAIKGSTGLPIADFRSDRFRTAARV
jgi:sarcosine oxidase subunit beta